MGGLKFAHSDIEYTRDDMSRYVENLEKKAIGILIKLKNKKITVYQAHFDDWLDKIKGRDEALSEELLKRYLNTLKELKK